MSLERVFESNRICALISEIVHVKLPFIFRKSNIISDVNQMWKKQYYSQRSYLLLGGEDITQLNLYEAQKKNNVFYFMFRIDLDITAWRDV